MRAHLKHPSVDDARKPGRQSPLRPRRHPRPTQRHPGRSMDVGSLSLLPVIGIAILPGATLWVARVHNGLWKH
ncbi:hypothetical protein [Arthrobacter methylotrophus]|uniref:hypothetical protein n=1 Tax=Arthrobacter methylotrophus TaxID=121291 RepID=UPI0031EEEE4A